MSAKLASRVGVVDFVITLAAVFTVTLSNRWRIPGGLTHFWHVTAALVICGVLLDVWLLARAPSMSYKAGAIIGVLLQVFVGSQLFEIAASYWY